MKRYIDLTHQLNNYHISVFPGDATPYFEAFGSIETTGFQITRFHDVISHTGTHVDAPSHLCPSGKYLDDYAIDDFIGKAYTLDCTELSSITLRDIQSIQSYISQIDFLLFYTGKQDQWGTDTFIENPITMNQEAAEWLAQFPLKGIGTDQISHDPLTDELIVHQIFLCKKQILLIENLANLSEIANRIVDFTCMPLRYAHADGSPVRAFATIDE